MVLDCHDDMAVGGGCAGEEEASATSEGGAKQSIQTENSRRVLMVIVYLTLLWGWSGKWLRGDISGCV